MQTIYILIDGEETVRAFFAVYLGFTTFTAHRLLARPMCGTRWNIKIVGRPIRTPFIARGHTFVVMPTSVVLLMSHDGTILQYMKCHGTRMILTRYQRVLNDCGFETFFSQLKSAQIRTSPLQEGRAFLLLSMSYATFDAFYDVIDRDVSSSNSLDQSNYAMVLCAAVLDPHCLACHESIYRRSVQHAAHCRLRYARNLLELIDKWLIYTQWRSVTHREDVNAKLQHPPAWIICYRLSFV